jgi:hypothetical protein
VPHQPGDDTRAHRRAIFQEVNGRIDDLSVRWNADDDLVVLCECGTRGCTQRIEIERAVYEEIRTDPARFLLVAGHETGAEHVVTRHDEYVIAERR